jgi:hypothetical protein
MRLAVRSARSENVCPCLSSVVRRQKQNAGGDQLDKAVDPECQQAEAMRSNCCGNRDNGLNEHPSEC